VVRRRRRGKDVEDAEEEDGAIVAVHLEGRVEGR
jgi:hypothetical protein